MPSKRHGLASVAFCSYYTIYLGMLGTCFVYDMYFVLMFNLLSEYMRGQLKDDSGLFSPSKYGFFFDWTIKAKDGYSLQLFIVTMDMYEEQPCQLDMLEVHLLWLIEPVLQIRRGNRDNLGIISHIYP